MKKRYSHTYNKYKFYADSPEDMIVKLTKLKFTAIDRNYWKKKVIEGDENPEKLKEIQIKYEQALKDYWEIRLDLENPEKY